MFSALTTPATAIGEAIYILRNTASTVLHERLLGRLGALVSRCTHNQAPRDCEHVASLTYIELIHRGTISGTHSLLWHALNAWPTW
jgi:hypothetical protein